MPFYTKKPVTVEAVQYVGVNAEECVRFCPSAMSMPGIRQMSIPTLEGTMIVSTGDWIIKGTAGEFYPCKDEIFKTIYAPASPLEDDLQLLEEDLKELQQKLESMKLYYCPGCDRVRPWCDGADDEHRDLCDACAADEAKIAWAREKTRRMKNRCLEHKDCIAADVICRMKTGKPATHRTVRDEDDRLPA